MAEASTIYEPSRRGAPFVAAIHGPNGGIVAAPNQSDPGLQGKTSRSPLERSLDPDDIQGKAIGAALRRKAEQRERAWDLKMRQTMGAICAGC